MSVAHASIFESTQNVSTLAELEELLKKEGAREIIVSPAFESPTVVYDSVIGGFGEYKYSLIIKASTNEGHRYKLETLLLSFEEAVYLGHERRNNAALRLLLTAVEQKEDLMIKFPEAHVIAGTTENPLLAKKAEKVKQEAHEKKILAFVVQ